MPALQGMGEFTPDGCVERFKAGLHQGQPRVNP